MTSTLLAQSMAKMLAREPCGPGHEGGADEVRRRLHVLRVIHKLAGPKRVEFYASTRYRYACTKRAVPPNK